jgi:hypothetical protein
MWWSHCHLRPPWFITNRRKEDEKFTVVDICRHCTFGRPLDRRACAPCLPGHRQG